MTDKINFKLLKPFGSTLAKAELPLQLVSDFLKDLKVQIRTQRPKKNNRNSLILRPTAKPKEIYIYVEDHAPLFLIKGFINSSAVLGTTKFLTDFGLKTQTMKAVMVKFGDIIFIKVWQ